MIPDLDIYRSANVMVKHHGQDAPIQVAMRADELLEKCDVEGYGVWRRILKAVEQFQREEPASQLLPRDRAVALRRRNPEKTLAGLLDGSMGLPFVFIAPLRVPCTTGSAPTSLRRR